MIKAFVWWITWLVILCAGFLLLAASLYDLLAVPLMSTEIWQTGICAVTGAFLVILELVLLRRRRRRRQERIELEYLEKLIARKTFQQRAAYEGTAFR